MTDLTGQAVVDVDNAFGAGSVVLVCEHASNHIPAAYDSLGLSEDVRKSHVAWDPGALSVAQHMSKVLDARLVRGCVSRLIYDCNRPPEAPDAIPAQSEVHVIPGNHGLDAQARAQRVEQVYQRFHRAVDHALSGVDAPILVTVHSFTPVYHGQSRKTEIGVLHDADTRLADRMLECAPVHTGLLVRRNDPYGPADGVTHTLQRHGIAHERLNVMLEVRNDLITTSEQQKRMGKMLAGWVQEALERVHKEWVHPC